MNRFIYITLGLISLLAPPILFITGISPGEVFLSYMVYVVISIFWVILDGIIRYGGPQNPGEFIPFFFVLFTLNRKKIHYSSLKNIYVSNSVSEGLCKAKVYKQGPLVSEFLFEVYYGDLNTLKSNIKSELDIIYKKEIEKNNRIKEVKTFLKGWNGYLDKQSERDSKLNDILK